MYFIGMFVHFKFHFTLKNSDVLMSIPCFAGQARKRRVLHPAAVPSLFLWSKPDSESVVARCVRAARRTQKAAPSVADHQATSSNDDVLQNDSVAVEEPLDVAEETVTDCQHNSAASELSVLTQTESIAMQCTAVQTDKSACNVLPFLSIERLQSDQKLLHYYTGLESAEKLYAVFATLGPAVDNLTYFR
jgi:hypothetical protein